MTSYIDFSACPNETWEHERRHHSGHRKVRPNYRHGWWLTGFRAFPVRPAKTLALKSGYRFRKCKESRRG